MAKVVYTNREIIVTGAVVLVCLLAVAFFPTEGFSQGLLSLVTFLVVAPLLYVRFILKRNWAEFGFQLGAWRSGLMSLLIAFIFAAPLLYILINYTDLLQKQSSLRIMQGRFGDFLYYEAVFSAALILVFEIFLRGFVLLGTANKLKAWSIGLQFFLALGLAWITGIFPLGISYYLVLGSFFSGIIAYRSRSLIYGLAFNAFFVLIADAVVIKLLQ